jgi:hypothetical protein
VILDTASKAVSAKQEGVTRVDRSLEQVYVHGGFGAQGASDQIALRMSPRLFGCEQASPNLFLDPGMVFRNLSDASLGDEIGPAVSDVGYMDLPPNNNSSHEGGTHATLGLISLSLAVDLLVSGMEGAYEAKTNVGRGITVVLVDYHLGSALAGHFACLMPAHAVGDQVDSPFLRQLLWICRDVVVHIILVVGLRTAYVCQLGSD